MRHERADRDDSLGASVTLPSKAGPLSGFRHGDRRGYEAGLEAARPLGRRHLP
jgi:hypothetical protein